MRSERVDTAEVLAGRLGAANRTEKRVRRLERRRVLEFWPEDLLRDAARARVPWRALVDPTRFGDVEPREVHDWVREFRASRGRWPSIDGLRRRFGRVSNHRDGNTNQLYAIDGDADALPAEGTASYGRFAMARVLERTWPGLVKTRLRFGRYQHSVDWKQFRTPLRLRRDVDLLEYPLIDEYDLRLREVKRPKAESLRALAAEFGSRDS